MKINSAFLEFEDVEGTGTMGIDASVHSVDDVDNNSFCAPTRTFRERIVIILS